MLNNSRIKYLAQTSDSGPTHKKTLKSNASAFGRRTFLKRVGLAGTAMLPAGSLRSQVATNAVNMDMNGTVSGPLSSGDVAILQFLAAAEILETDLWQQYTELALGNAAYQMALGQLDEDMATYVNQNTRDENSHQDFINAYLKSKGEQPVNLEQFRTLPSSQATGANQTAKRLTNLMNLTVDTSWYTRYR